MWEDPDHLANCVSPMKDKFLLFDDIELGEPGAEEFLFFGEILHIFKHLKRAGWTFRGVGDAESLAGHSYGVILWSLWLARRHRTLHPDIPLDEGKVLLMASVHDLPESLTGDLTPWQRELLFGKDGKKGVIESERRFWDKLLRGGVETELFAEMFEAWREYREGSSPEARIVKRADALDCVIQALFYRRTYRAPLEQFKSLISAAAGDDGQLEILLRTLWKRVFGGDSGGVE